MHCTFFEQPQKGLHVTKYGQAHQVVKENTFYLEELKEREVLAKVLVAPVNIKDIYTIRGTFSTKPNIPFVPGDEAVMEIMETGSDVTGLKVGDRVIPKVNAMGTWRSAIVEEEDKFIKIPADIDIVTASILPVNPCSAYRMLTDFVELKPGDVVIQNRPNSAFGQAVIQIAATKGIHTVNVVRDRPDFEEVQSRLASLGATRVVSYRELRTSKKLEELPKPSLALNGFSGKSGEKILKQLANGGTMVSYGGIKPMTLGAGSLIFNDLKLRGFWLTAWNKLHFNDPERLKMFDYLFDLSRKGKFQCPPHELVPFEYYRAVLFRTGLTKRKIHKVYALVFE